MLESTSDYWRPVFYVLSEKLDVVLVKASDVKAMPGRKSDVCVMRNGWPIMLRISWCVARLCRRSSSGSCGI